jgi:hypothetical protein
MDDKINQDVLEAYVAPTEEVRKIVQVFGRRA